MNFEKFDVNLQLKNLHLAVERPWIMILVSNKPESE